MKRIAVFGGTFDPIHIGHCMVATSVVRSGVADEVWLMVSPQNPFKTDKHLTDEQLRLQMVRLACNEMRNVKASDFEFTLPRPSYTAATLRAMKSTWPEYDFRLLVGADNWLAFDRWRNPDEIIRDFGVIVYQRGGVNIPDGFNPIAKLGKIPEGKVTILRGLPEATISSTYIRDLATKESDLKFLVPGEVEHFIAENRLYHR